MPARPEHSPGARLLRALHRIEDGILAALLTAMILLGVAQIALRNLFDAGLTWSDPLLRVLVLWVGLLGALAATREDRHIVIDALLRLAPRRLRHGVRVLALVFTAAVTALLAYHAARFVAMEFELGGVVFAAVPAWLAELIIPVSFALMTLRFLLLAAREARAALRPTAEG